MQSFAITDHDVELYNVRNEVGALRALHLAGERDGAVVSVTLWLLAGEPRPSVAQTGPLRWEVSFPSQHYEAVIDLLRQAAPVWITLAEPEHVALSTRPPAG